MIKKLANTNGYKVVADYGVDVKIIEKEGSDLIYYPLSVFTFINYKESKSAKLNYEPLIQKIKKHDIDAIELDDQIYISDNSKADLVYYKTLILDRLMD